jgi:hypothetical protein
MLGGMAALGLGIGMGSELSRWPLRAIRVTLAGVTAVAAMVIALSVRGIIG